MKLLNKYCFSGVFVAFFNFNGNVLAAERLYVSATTMLEVAEWN